MQGSAASPPSPVYEGGLKSFASRFTHLSLSARHAMAARPCARKKSMLDCADYTVACLQVMDVERETVNAFLNADGDDEKDLDPDSAPLLAFSLSTPDLSKSSRLDTITPVDWSRLRRIFGEHTSVTSAQDPFDDKCDEAEQPRPERRLFSSDPQEEFTRAPPCPNARCLELKGSREAAIRAAHAHMSRRLFSEAAYESWHGSYASHGFLWMAGKPGYGKTVLHHASSAHENDEIGPSTIPLLPTTHCAGGIVTGLLLQQGDRDIKHIAGLTALHCELPAGDPGGIKLLLERPSNVAKHKPGCTVLDLATSDGREEIADLLDEVSTSWTSKIHQSSNSDGENEMDWKPQATHRDQRQSKTGGQEAELNHIGKERYDSTPRLLAKMGILMISPACLHVVGRYAMSRGLTSPAPADSAQSIPWLSDHIQIPLQRPDWLTRPDSLLFLAASMNAGYMLASYHQLNVRDRFQNWLVFATFLTSLCFGLLRGNSIMATMLTFVPWGMYFSLIASDVFHAGMKLRRVPQGEISAVPEKQ